METDRSKMNTEQEAIVNALLQELDGERGDIAEAIRPILIANVEANRAQSFLGKESTTPADYVQRVRRYYDDWHAHIYQVQVVRSHTVWEPLYVLLQKWAYAFLRRRNFPAHGDRYEHAIACAADAAATILDTRFPYDVHFERWAYVILQNICLRHIDRHWNSSDVLHNNPVALDEFDDWIHNLAPDDARDDVSLAALRHDLLQAIAALGSDARQEFLLLRYFHQRTFDEISVIMNRSKNALYKLHFDALAELRKIWDEKQDNNG